MYRTVLPHDDENVVTDRKKKSGSLFSFLGCVYYCVVVVVVVKKMSCPKRKNERTNE